METGGEEQVQSRGGEEREQGKREERAGEERRGDERERESPCAAHQPLLGINPLSRVASFCI